MVIKEEDSCFLKKMYTKEDGRVNRDIARFLERGGVIRKIIPANEV